MPKWEYKKVYFGVLYPVDDEINNKQNGGWEFVSITPLYTENLLLALFRRELVKPEEPFKAKSAEEYVHEMVDSLGPLDFVFKVGDEQALRIKLTKFVPMVDSIIADVRKECGK